MFHLICRFISLCTRILAAKKQQRHCSQWSVLADLYLLLPFVNAPSQSKTVCASQIRPFNISPLFLCSFLDFSNNFVSCSKMFSLNWMYQVVNDNAIEAFTIKMLLSWKYFSSCACTDACLQTHRRAGAAKSKTGENTNSSAKESSEQSVQRSPGPPQA